MRRRDANTAHHPTRSYGRSGCNLLALAIYSPCCLHRCNSTPSRGNGRRSSSARRPTIVPRTPGKRTLDSFTRKQQVGACVSNGSDLRPIDGASVDRWVVGSVATIHRFRHCHCARCIGCLAVFLSFVSAGRPAGRRESGRVNHV